MDLTCIKLSDAQLVKKLTSFYVTDSLLCPKESSYRPIPGRTNPVRTFISIFYKIRFHIILLRVVSRIIVVRVKFFHPSFIHYASFLHHTHFIILML
jgi:hypothetical protein